MQYNEKFYTKGLNKFFNIQKVCSLYKSCTLHNILLVIIKILRASYCPLEWWQPVDSRLPVRSLMAAVPCGHGTDRQKRTEGSHEYTHHRVKGLKFPMGTTVITPSSFTFRLLKSNSNS